MFAMSVCVDETCESVVRKSAIDRSAGEMSRGCGVVRAGCVRGWLPREKRRLGSAGAGTLKPRSCSSVGQFRHRPRLRLQVPYEVGAPPLSNMPARKQPPKHLLSHNSDKNHGRHTLSAHPMYQCNTATTFIASKQLLELPTAI